ncbi:hypothetical protein HAX54_028999 [Datura stramonium]|uniref:Uncharacterized protein n=1 Tax=Datura stramonium TaxID=4076 RepID=A0ABS8V553_DATST|nr:hypothetical protein [Datura stramonium]
MAIRRYWSGAKKDDTTSKVINEFVESVVAGDAIRMDDHHHSCGVVDILQLVLMVLVALVEDILQLVRTFDVKKIFHTCWTEALTKAQVVTEADINKLISKMSIYSTSRISEPFTLLV